MTGKEIRAFIIGSGVRLWQVAAALGMRDNEFSKRLRMPFTESECDNIKRIVKELTAQESGEASG